ncbi:protein NRT1/ PTR FAMILY 5.2-like [Cicer arietinum]|uniref:Protein NRT1/ PTR FAMILY 5.2-like isoform X1 n=1 Tax=Cicer arietinum TaxID=3827 RepID=A0A1S2YS27_CICAR|nr:protein NRT1/ PTR FAMILY 5.2-like isoform X1 [Cicer arietinum]
MEFNEEKGQLEDYTQDGTVDLQGRPIQRSKTGRWKACYFLVGYELFERMAYHGISTNLVVYLTNKLHQGTVEASNNISNWGGSVWIMPLVGAYVADAYLGRYWTFVFASCIYLLGMCLLTLSVSLPSLRPPECDKGIEYKNCPKASMLQKGIFFLALYIIVLGTGGTKPNISTMGADQFDDFDPKEKSHKLSFFNWWYFSILIGVLFSTTLFVYIQDNVGWTLGYGLPTIGLAFSILVFLLGTPFYRHKLPPGSPITRMLQVFVAALRKWKTHIPEDANELHELSMEEYACNGRIKIAHTSFFSFLDKAAIKTGHNSSWMLCTVTQIEETKQMSKLIPILIFSIIPSIFGMHIGTLFIKQGMTLDKRMGPHFNFSPASLSAVTIVFMMIGIAVYDCIFVPVIRRYTKNPRGITILQRIEIGLVLNIIILVIASLVERIRLNVARENNLLGMHDTIPLTIFILLPQYALSGISDNFIEIAKMEFFYDQAPENMKSLGTAFSTATYGLGGFLSTFILSAVADITQRHGRSGWILDNLNVSHLDYYYAFVAALNIVNFLGFVVVAKFFVYNDVKQSKTSLEMHTTSSKDNARLSQSTSQLDAKS